MVKRFVLPMPVSTSVPDQLPICQPEAGTAPLKEITSPDKYRPVEQPVELVGAATGFVPLPVWLRASA